MPAGLGAQPGLGVQLELGVQPELGLAELLFAGMQPRPCQPGRSKNNQSP